MNNAILKITNYNGTTYIQRKRLSGQLCKERLDILKYYQKLKMEKELEVLAKTTKYIMKTFNWRLKTAYPFLKFLLFGDIKNGQFNKKDWQESIFRYEKQYQINKQA